jgi:hypothetical protein
LDIVKMPLTTLFSVLPLKRAVVWHPSKLKIVQSNSPRNTRLAEGIGHLKLKPFVHIEQIRTIRRFLDRLSPYFFGFAFFTQRPEHLPQVTGHFII